jgi:hypothetical protein
VHRAGSIRALVSAPSEAKMTVVGAIHAVPTSPDRSNLARSQLIAPFVSRSGANREHENARQGTTTAGIAAVVRHGASSASGAPFPERGNGPLTRSLILLRLPGCIPRPLLAETEPPLRASKTRPSVHSGGRGPHLPAPVPRNESPCLPGARTRRLPPGEGCPSFRDPVAALETAVDPNVRWNIGLPDKHGHITG